MMKLAMSSYSGCGVWKIHQPVGYQALDLPRSTITHSGAPDFSPDGALLMVANQERIFFFDPATGRRLSSELISGAVSASFLADGKTLVTTDRRQLSFWHYSLVEQADGTRAVQLAQVREHTPPDTSWLEIACLNHNRTKAVIAINWNAAILVDLQDPKKLTRIDGLQNPASGSLSPDGNHLCMGTFHGRGPLVWDVTRQRMIKRLEQDNSNAYFSPDGSTLLIGGTASYRFYRQGTWELIQEIPTSAGSDLPNVACWSVNGDMLALATARRYVDLVDGHRFTTLARLTSPDPFPLGHLAFSPNGIHFAAGTARNRVELWNVQALGEQLKALGLGEVGLASERSARTANSPAPLHRIARER
jgi:WD40 repeat protein